MPLEKVVVVNPEIMNGTPCFRGTRVPFKNLIDYLEGGHSLGDFLEQFPTVTRDMAVQALEDLQPLTGTILSALEKLQPGVTVTVPE